MSGIAENIRKLANANKCIERIQQATVVSVDEGKRICVVKLLVSGAEIPDVRLCAVQDENDDFYVMVPKVKSTVWIGFSDDSYEAVLIAVSVVTKTIFNGGKQKGMLLHDPVKREIEKLNTNLTILKNAITASFSAQDSILTGIGSAANTAFNPVVATMQQQDLSDLENKKILQ